VSARTEALHLRVRCTPPYFALTSSAHFLPSHTSRPLRTQGGRVEPTCRLLFAVMRYISTGSTDNNRCTYCRKLVTISVVVLPQAVCSALERIIAFEQSFAKLFA
jgi:hypothetical protein